MNVDLGIWSKLTRVVVVLCLVAGLLGIAVWYLPEIRKNERMRKVVQGLDNQIKRGKSLQRNSRPPLMPCATTPKPSNGSRAKSSATPSPAKPWCASKNRPRTITGRVRPQVSFSKNREGAKVDRISAPEKFYHIPRLGTSHRHDLFFLVRHVLVNLLAVIIRELLQILFRLLFLVLRHAAVAAPCFLS